MARLANGEFNILLSLDFDDFLPDCKLFPMIAKANLIRICRIEFFNEEVDIIILEHGKSPPAEVVVAQDAKWQSREMMAIKINAGIRDMSLIPHGRLRKSDVCIIRQNGKSRRRPGAADDPSIAALNQRHWQCGECVVKR